MHIFRTHLAAVESGTWQNYMVCNGNYTYKPMMLLEGYVTLVTLQDYHNATHAL